VGPDPDFTVQKIYFMQITSQNPHELGDIFILQLKLKLSPPHHGTCLNKGLSSSVGPDPDFTVQKFYFMKITLKNLIKSGAIFSFAVNLKTGPATSRHLFKRGILSHLILFFGLVGPVLVLFTVQESYFMQIASQNLLEIGDIFIFCSKIINCACYITVPV